MPTGESPPGPVRSQCPICESDTTVVGEVIGRLTPTPYTLRRCAACAYAFIANPRTDYSALYDDAYYAGRGADRLVDYAMELEQPTRTVRRYEWRGILRALEHLAGPLPGRVLLDYGCGNGGLVRAGREMGLNISGFDQGSICDQARGLGIPVLRPDELQAMAGTVDVVTAIEVLEHLVDPLEVLRQIRALLKPGGLLYVTTGNAAPFRNKLTSWRYVLPEIHVGFFEPTTLREALLRSGFTAEWPGFLPGFTDIIRFKVLKSLGKRTRGGWERLVPWALVSPLVDRRFRLSAHPAGRAA